MYDLQILDKFPAYQTILTMIPCGYPVIFAFLVILAIYCRGESLNVIIKRWWGTISGISFFIPMVVVGCLVALVVISYLATTYIRHPNYCMDYVFVHIYYIQASRTPPKDNLVCTARDRARNLPPLNAGKNLGADKHVPDDLGLQRMQYQLLLQLLHLS
jgi:hypothetical protein